jgi:serine/threonine kinase 16
MQSSDLQKVTKNEIDSLQKFQHPNIIKMIDFSFSHEPGKGQVAYLLFPYTSKGSLRDILNNQLKGASRPQLFNVLCGFRDICKAVNVLHTFKPAYVHRDIKPEVSNQRSGITSA